MKDKSQPSCRVDSVRIFSFNLCWKDHRHRLVEQFRPQIRKRFRRYRTHDVNVPNRGQLISFDDGFSKVEQLPGDRVAKSELIDPKCELKCQNQREENGEYRSRSGIILCGPFFE